jgi:thiosulfate/3-mercaptopyruvate sulfurtransferase
MALIEAQELKKLIDEQQDFLLFDCRFDLVDSEAGYKSYLEGHIPGAIYVHSDKDLASEKTGRNGRHPLPSINAWQKTYAALGITPNSRVVIYDNQSCMYAVRLWWMLKAVGHQHIELLNGGYQIWCQLGYPSEQSETFRKAVPETTLTPFMNLVLVGDVVANLESKNFTILDARSNDRFYGQNETLDPVAGHIPGALNRFFKDNLKSDGTFKDPDVLRHEFQLVIGNISSEKIVHQCGSGITACHNMFAMELAGLMGSSIYAGSWSEWSSDPSRPVER